jgi:hypothetical protein
MPLTVACAAILAALPLQGHVIRLEKTERTVVYEFRGTAVRQYLGGRAAPESRRGEFSGRYEVATVIDADKLAVVGKTYEASSPDLAASDLARGKGGIWRGDPFAYGYRYTWDGKDAIPFALSVPFWPFGWAPIVPDRGLKIGDRYTIEVEIPTQSFLEDDPVGKFKLPVTLQFTGPKYGDVRTYGFRYETDAAIDAKVNHPEDPELTLKGSVKIEGTIDVTREDGRIERSLVLLTVDIGLEGPGYPFGFSKCKGVYTAKFDRVR